MMNKIFLFGVAIVFLMALASADLQKIELYKNERVFVVCQNNGQECSASARANITIIAPNGTFVAVNQTMMKESIGTFFYNRTYNTPGIYHASVLVEDGTSSAPFSFDFQVTPDRRSVGIPMTLYITATVLLLIGLIFSIILFGALSGFIFMATGVYIMIYGLFDFADVYTRAIAFLSIGLGLYLTISSIYEGMIPE